MTADNRQKLLLVLAIAAATLLIGDKAVYSPLVRLWQARQQEVRKLRTQVTDGGNLIKREQIVRGRWDEMRTNTLPNNPSLAQEKMLKAIQDWAQESGASLNGITPQWKSDADDYQTLVCRVNATGTLWMLSRFIYDIEKGPMGVKMESVEISSTDNSGQTLSLGLQISGLVLASQEP